LAASYCTANSANRGDLRGDLRNEQQALAIYTRTGDRRYKGVHCAFIAEDLLRLGDLEGAESYARRALGVAEVTGFIVVQARAHKVIGQVALCRGALHEALQACRTALEFLGETGQPWSKDIIHTMGRAHLAQGERENAVSRFHEALVFPSSVDFLGPPPPALSGLEAAYADPEAFRDFFRRFRETHPGVGGLPTVQWFLEPYTAAAVRGAPLQHARFAASTSPDRALSSDWVWHDLYDDCHFCIVPDDGLEIHAANGRDLWSINLSAPRLLRNAPQSSVWAVQTICNRAAAERPAIGGLLLWQDQDNYLRLNRGTAGEREIAFQGCIDNQDLIIGRGRLDVERCERVFLRLERKGERVNALCSADGVEWFTVGHVAFPVADPLQIGLHAIGHINRSIYHGAYSEGAAIRFESFTVWA
jgi:hypothetical protein